MNGWTRMNASPLSVFGAIVACLLMGLLTNGCEQKSGQDGVSLEVEKAKDSNGVNARGSNEDVEKDNYCYAGCLEKGENEATCKDVCFGDNAGKTNDSNGATDEDWDDDKGYWRNAAGHWATLLKVSPSTILAVRRGDTWKHLKHSNAGRKKEN